MPRHFDGELRRWVTESECPRCGLVAARYDGEACALVALGVEQDHSVDKALLLSLRRRACAKKVAAACVYVGKVEPDSARAMDAYATACTGGNLEGCEELAKGYQEDKGVPSSHGRTCELFSQACGGGRGSACGSVVRLLEFGEVPLATRIRVHIPHQ